jgi:hypothetical protein
VEGPHAGVAEGGCRDDEHEEQGKRASAHDASL